MRYATIAASAACIGLALFSHCRHCRRGQRQRAATNAPTNPFSLVRGRFTWCRAWIPGRSSRACSSARTGRFAAPAFSIAHRGAPLQFPEHTKESYEAGARMGAGIVECDVTFTKDGQLVCRHDECDLHTTTNIVEHRTKRELLGALVRRQFQPALLRQRHHAGAVPDAERKDGCLQPGRHHGRGVPRRHGELAHGSLQRPRHAADAQGKHRAQPAPRRQTHAGAQGGQSGARRPGLRQPG